MKEILDHNVDSSFYLWLDNLLVEKNLGHQSYSGALRATTSMYSGATAYSAPHRQFVYDNTVSGVISPSGVYVGNVFAPTGTGLALDTYHGQALFTVAPSQPVTARYSYKEVNVYFTSQNAQQVLFENKFVLNPRSQPVFDNFDAKNVSYPCIFIKSSAGDNKTICMDGCAQTIIPIRLVFLADSMYLFRAVTSALRDQKEAFVPIFNVADLPFDYRYSLKNGSFDYSSSVNAIQQDTTRLAFIRGVYVSDFKDKLNNELGPQVFGAIIDIDLEFVRFPRS